MKRNLASATAARNATHHRRARDRDPTMIRLFLTVVPEVGPVRSRRGNAAASDATGNHVGVKLLISSSGLKAVEIIQKTGKTRTTNTASPTTFQAARRSRRRRCRRIEAARGAARDAGCAAASVKELIDASPIFTIRRT